MKTWRIGVRIGFLMALVIVAALLSMSSFGAFDEVVDGEPGSWLCTADAKVRNWDGHCGYPGSGSVCLELCVLHPYGGSSPTGQFSCLPQAQHGDCS